MKRVYIAGPMTGYPGFNYAAFDDAAGRIRFTHADAKVINPADNHNRQTDLPRWMYISKTLDQIRGLANLAYSTAADSMVAVLDGWRDSPGARLEVDAAQQLGLPVYQLECILDPHWEDDCRVESNARYPKCEALAREAKIEAQYEALANGICEEPHETIQKEDVCEAMRVAFPVGAKLSDTPVANPDRVKVTEAATPVRAQVLDEAKRLICGDRNNQYGPPGKDFNRTANVLTSLGYGKEEVGGGFGVIEDHDVAVIMIALKLSRIMWTPGKADTWVDVAGYAGCGSEVAGVDL